jgi:hypothetical protein
MDKQLINRIIDVLDLELEVDLADPEWDAVVNKKLDLLIYLQKLQKEIHESH